jgi:parallel beta-helix repeat protein
VTRGDGAPVQGIFFRDTFDTMPYENITITKNLVIGGLYNGITLDGAKGFTVSDNIVSGLADQKSWIRLENAVGGVVQNNRSTDYISGPATRSSRSAISGSRWTRKRARHSSRPGPKRLGCRSPA